MGGAIALSLALDHSDRVCGMGLISCGAQLPIAASILENASNPATVQLAIRALLDLMHLTGGASDLEQQTFKKLSTIRQSLFHGDLCACEQFDASERLSFIETSTLVVCGTEDKLTPQHFSRILAGGINGAALQMIDNAGHLVMLEKPHRVAGILGVFLKTIPFIPGT
jgi:pimeloyl-ACP methyl ester carboxylesterase